MLSDKQSIQIQPKEETKRGARSSAMNDSMIQIINHHTINSFKRIDPHTSPVSSSILRTNQTKISQADPRCSLTIILLFMILFIRITNSVVICPKDISSIYPCTCNNGTQGLLIKCTRSNLVTLAISLKNLDEQSVEQLEIVDSSVGQLFGPLFNDSEQYKFHSTLRELDIRNSNLKGVDTTSGGWSKELLVNIQYLMLDRNQLLWVPSELVNNMTNLRLLNLSTNAIQAIDNQNVFTKQLNNLTELDLSQNKISRLAKGAFNSLINLEILNLNGNEISKLDKNLLAFGRKLKLIDLSYNKLTTLDRQDFNELTNLETLKISNNQLTTIPRSIFSRNAKLYYLDLSFNKLEDIDTYLFKSVRFLKDLNMSGNLIKEITKNTFSPTTRIKRIDMSQNLIQNLAPETFKGLEWLERIDLSHNQIVNISNDAFQRIYTVEIDLSYNKLQRIFYYAFHEVSNITKLDLSHNLINESISMIAFEQTDCTHLDLSYNQIQDISKIPISNLTSVRIIDLSHNQITEFNKKSFSQKIPLYELHTIDASYNNISQISGNILERLKSIRTFNISHNSLRRLTSGGLGTSPTLLELDLSHNNIVEVVAGTLVGLVSMKNLDISHNRLKKMIPIPVALNSIHLEHNEISQLSKSAFPSLNSLLELYLDHNRISHVEEGTFSTLLALHTLSMSNNNLSSIPAQALKDLASLQLLKLDGNNIQRLGRRAFGTLPIVFHLYLNHNNISQVSDHAFDGMLQLLTLNMSYNILHELPPETFYGLVSLRELDLSNNQLNRFENKTRSAMEDLLSLEWLDLSDNKLSMITGKTFLSSPYIPYKLTHLDLSNNLIGIVMNTFADGLKKVEWLSLKSNIINEIYPNVIGNASNLRFLDLSYNKLRGNLKEGTFDGRLVNLTTILLNNNKLTTIRAKEFDQLKRLMWLDLSDNRIEQFQLDFIRWFKRGMILDLRFNKLDCQCNLLPFLAWIDNIKERTNQSQQSAATTTTTTTGKSNNLPAEATAGILSSINDNNRQLKMHNNQLINLPVSPTTSQPISSQYHQSAQLVSNINCSKPDILSGKSIMQMIDLSSSLSSSSLANAGLNCDGSYLEEAAALKRLKAPIQFAGAEPYYHNGQQHLKIGWNLVVPELDLIYFIVIKAKFQQPFDSNVYLTKSKQRDEANLQQQLIEQQVERVLYSKRSVVFHDLDPASFYVICISYETASKEDTANYMIESLLNSTTTSSTGSKSGSSSQQLFNAILSDYQRYNCMNLDRLLHLDGSGEEKLVSGATTIMAHSMQIFFFYLVSVSFYLITSKMLVESIN